jgi:hypothetical protein
MTLAACRRCLCLFLCQVNNAYLAQSGHAKALDKEEMRAFKKLAEAYPHQVRRASVLRQSAVSDPLIVRFVLALRLLAPRSDLVLHTFRHGWAWVRCLREDDDDGG